MKNININHEAINKLATRGGIVIGSLALLLAFKSCPWFDGQVEPVPTDEPTIETPIPTIDPIVTPIPTPIVTPIIDPEVTPTPTPVVTPSVEDKKPVDNSKVYRDKAQRIINNSNAKVQTIKANRAEILNKIKDLQNYYSELEKDYNTLKGLLAEADKIISENKDSSISKDLQAARNEIKKQLDEVAKQLENVLKETDVLISEYNKLDTSDIEKEISNLQKGISNVKNENDLNPYYELEKKLNEILGKSEQVKDEASKHDKDTVDHTPVSNAQKALDDMKDKKDKSDHDKNNGGGSGSGQYHPVDPTPVDPTPTPTPELPPVTNNTYDKNGNIDDTIFTDTDEPLEEPDMDLDGPVHTI